jgi:hypothetical protein
MFSQFCLFLICVSLVLFCFVQRSGGTWNPTPSLPPKHPLPPPHSSNAQPSGGQAMGGGVGTVGSAFTLLGSKRMSSPTPKEKPAENPEQQVELSTLPSSFSFDCSIG